MKILGKKVKLIRFKSKQLQRSKNGEYTVAFLGAYYSHIIPKNPKNLKKVSKTQKILEKSWKKSQNRKNL